MAAGRRTGTIVQRGLVLLALAVFLAPIAWLYTTAFKPGREIFVAGPSSPEWNWER